MQCQDWVLVTEVLKVIAFGQYGKKCAARWQTVLKTHALPHLWQSCFPNGFWELVSVARHYIANSFDLHRAPLDDWSWHLAFVVGKGGFRNAPKRLPVWHRLRLEGLARVGQNHLCRFSRVFQSSCLRLTLATGWLRGVVRQCWGIHFVRVTSLKNPSTPLEYVHADPTASSCSSPSIFHVLPSSLSSTPSWSRRVQRVLNKCFEYKLAEEKWPSR